MPKPNPHEVTRLLLAWSEGDKAAMDQLIPLVYGELRRLAKQHMRHERAGHTLQTTALIHEADLRKRSCPSAHRTRRSRLSTRAVDGGGQLGGGGAEMILVK